MKSSNKALRHKTLSAYYPHLQILFDHLAVSTGDEAVLLDSDNAGYRELLINTVCATSHAPEILSFPLKGPIYGSQQEAIDRVLKELGRVLRKPGEGQNVLLAGDKVRGSIFLSSTLES